MLLEIELNVLVTYLSIQVEKRYVEGNDDDDEMEDNEMDNSLKTKLEELNQVASILTQVGKIVGQ